MAFAIRLPHDLLADIDAEAAVMSKSMGTPIGRADAIRMALKQWVSMRRKS